MGRILLIEPARMLQHAFVIALAPEHQLVTRGRIADGDAADCDAVIVDAVALRQAGGLAANALARVESWGKPTIWLDDQPASGTSARILATQLPLMKEELLRLLVQAVGGASVVKPAVNPLAKSHGAGSAPEPAKAAGTDENIIELVEIVEVESDSKKS